jgi:hypothetical protein
MSTSLVITQRLFVFQTPGEVSSMLPLLADLSEKREDFKFLTLSNASKSLLPCKAALDATRFQVLLTH